MWWQSIREKINLAIYGSKERALRRLRFVTFFVSLFAIGILIYYYGFPTSAEEQEILLLLVQGCFVFYFFRYFMRYFYSFEPLKYFRSTWFEGLLMLYLLAEGISFHVSGFLLIQTFFLRLGFDAAASFTALFINSYMCIILFNEIVRSTEMIPRLRLHPAHLFLLSFLLLILAGTALLLLPEMTVSEGHMPFVDALFISTSAVSTTGLSMVDTATYFTFKGHLVIMLLMKSGGLNVIAFGAFFAMISKFGIGLRQHEIVEDFLSRDSLISAKGMFGRILVWSTLIELIGGAFIYPAWDPSIAFRSRGDKLFTSVFHSVSAFNCGGFSLFSDGFHHPFLRYSYGLHIVIILLMFLGHLGMMPIFDLFSLSRIRERLRYPWKQLEFQTKIAFYVGLLLVAISGGAFFALEYSHALRGMTMGESLLTSLFQAVSARNSGFNTIDIGRCTYPVLIILCVAMLMGSASGSAGGGIRTSTLAILWASAVAVLKGRKKPHLFKRAISAELFSRAATVFVFFLGCATMVILALSITESHISGAEGRSIMDVVFEAVSAITTTGLSMGITAELSEAGKYILIAAMYIGRVGTLAIAYILVRPPISTRYTYPEGHTLVG